MTSALPHSINQTSQSFTGIKNSADDVSNSSTSSDEATPLNLLDLELEDTAQPSSFDEYEVESEDYLTVSIIEQQHVGVLNLGVLKENAGRLSTSKSWVDIQSSAADVSNSSTSSDEAAPSNLLDLDLEEPVESSCLAELDEHEVKDYLRVSIIEQEQDAVHLGMLNENEDLLSTSKSSAEVEPSESLKPQINCDFCSVSFQKPKKLESHMNWHTIEPPFRCKHIRCKTLVEFLSLPKLKQHFVDFHPKFKRPSYLCTYCRRILQSPESWRKHMMTYHWDAETERMNSTARQLEVAKKVAEKAAKHVKTAKEIKTVKTVKTGKPGRPAKITMKVVKKEKIPRIIVTGIHNFSKTSMLPSFSCYFCKYVPKNTFSYWIHMTRHTKEKPHHCEICGIYMQYGNTFNIHRRKCLAKVRSEIARKKKLAKNKIIKDCMKISCYVLLDRLNE